MFESLYTSHAVLRRHRNGPLAGERAAYLERLSAQGMAQGTLLRHARYCLCIAEELERWPPDSRLTPDDVGELARTWAAKRVALGRASSMKWPEAHVCLIATDFLRAIGRFHPHPPAAPGRFDEQLDDFLATQRARRWLSEATCRSAHWQVTRFLTYLEQQGRALGDVRAEHVDAYLQHMAARWCRVSLRTSAKALRSWFQHCEVRGWGPRGLAAAILLPRVYRHEALPLGPTWQEVARMLAKTAGNGAAPLRDHAILRLLAVYGLRSGEVRRLRLDDLDWQRERIRIVRSKSSAEQSLPLEPSVGNAIARYLRAGRPTSQSRVVFLTLRAPHRPLSAGGLYSLVHRHGCNPGSQKKGRGPHGVRHACARHLLECGHSFKAVGDHLGHRSLDATRLYAKVDLATLRQVAVDDLGGLT